MSRVTVGDLYSDLVNVETPFEDWKKARSVEVVPRKMVEMIMQDIRERKAYCEDGSYADFVLGLIHDYAESLLEQFEEEGE